MSETVLRGRDFTAELNYSASRSSGPGGQHVNKVNTKVELRFHVDSSVLLSDEEKQLVHEKLANRITNDGFFLLTAQTERSQSGNKEKVTELFYELLEKALTPRKKRKTVKPSLTSRIKRKEDKQKQSTKKQLRKPPEY